MPRFLTVALSLSLLLGGAGCADESDTGQVEVADLRLVRQADGYPEVSGLFINRTPEAITSADIGISLFDEQNLEMDEPVRLVVRNIAPGDSARFRRKLDVDARGAALGYVIQN